jgi:dynactin 4
LWTTLDIGIKFEKPTNIRAQLDRLANGGVPKQPSKSDAADLTRKSSLARDPISPTEIEPEKDEKEEEHPLDSAARFTALRSFYKEQITSSTINEGGLSNSSLELAYSSPNSLARIMNLYSNMTTPALKKSRQKPSMMREALTKKEGLQVSTTSPSNPPEYIDASSISQLSHQHPSYLGDPTAKTVASLRPMPALLRTKRSKRCATCKHILVKPESKASSTRYRIKLIALNYLPSINLKPLPVPDGLKPAGPDGQDVVLQPGQASQWILTLRNPLFENVNVTLASPSVTPGRHAHKVTILCPQFEIGKNGDVWDDALNPNALNKQMMGAGGGEQIAGKLYDQGRNWVSVVIEIVPKMIVWEAERDREEDEEVIEVPIRVRLEWKVSEEEAGEGKKKSSEKLEDGEVDDGRREVAYWMVLGVGRVAC